MKDYIGPERRDPITFTREDSDRLVRLESQNLAILTQLETMHTAVATQAARLGKLEKLQSWFMGIGSAVTFIITSVIMYSKNL